jgi:hypothetical protein
MLSQPKSAVHQQPAKLFQQHGGIYKEIMTSILPLKMLKPERLPRQKRTGSQIHCIAPLTL